jgi:hypothetical protein
MTSLPAWEYSDSKITGPLPSTDEERLSLRQTVVSAVLAGHIFDQAYLIDKIFNGDREAVADAIEPSMPDEYSSSCRESHDGYVLRAISESRPPRFHHHKKKFALVNKTK